MNKTKISKSDFYIFKKRKENITCALKNNFMTVDDSTVFVQKTIHCVVIGWESLALKKIDFPQFMMLL